MPSRAIIARDDDATRAAVAKDAPPPFTPVVETTRPPTGEAAPAKPRRLRRRRFSPLTRRILFVNLLALALLVAGLLYLDDFRQGQIRQEFASLTTQGRIIAAALGEAASDAGAGAAGIDERLQPELSRAILRRLVEPTRIRARLFGAAGEPIADTQFLGRPGGLIEAAPLAPPTPPREGALRWVDDAYDAVVALLPSRAALRPYAERPDGVAQDYEENVVALGGEIASALRSAATDDSTMVLSVALPVQRFKQVLGVLMLTADSREIDRIQRELRYDILKVFAATLVITVLLSLYLASTIARPIRRLAFAAERVSRGRGIGGGRALAGAAGPAIPDLSRRGDEIGDLSVTLNDMTGSLWQRLDAIERFAADVAHEIRNPLTSLKSAVETASRVKDPEQQRRLLQVIVEDVGRIDRLLADISDASRLDAELSRAASGPVDIAGLLRALVEVQHAAARPGDAAIILELAGREQLVVPGLEDRLAQVFRNIIANALSFSPPGGRIRLAAARRDNRVEIAIEDDGPGVPEDKLEAIFDRFYSERPTSEKFGTHSGLGLSISRQIVLAHGGAIAAENRHDADGRVLGARFIIRLPVE